MQRESSQLLKSQKGSNSSLQSIEELRDEFDSIENEEVIKDESKGSSA